MTTFMEESTVIDARPHQVAYSSAALGAPIHTTGTLRIWGAQRSGVITVAAPTPPHEDDDAAEDAWLGQLAMKALEEMSTEGSRAVPLAELLAELDTDPEG